MKTIHDIRYIRVIDLLRSARRQRGLTQAQVAKALGWHRTAVSNIETMERRLDLLEAQQLCQLYNLTLGNLAAALDGEGGGDAAEPT